MEVNSILTAIDINIFIIVIAHVREMGFCLTTGKTWLFGIVDAAPLTGKICWITNQFRIAAAPEFDIIKSLVKLILLWVRHSIPCTKLQY